jgi:hypothetical protein
MPSQIRNPAFVMGFLLIISAISFYKLIYRKRKSGVRRREAAVQINR